MGVHSQHGTKTLILWESIVLEPIWEAGGTKTVTKPTSTVCMASTVTIRYTPHLSRLSKNEHCLWKYACMKYIVVALIQGIVWIDWKGKDSSIPFTEMKFRPSKFSPATHG